MLKSLQLFGFKSFADRTQFDFANGITCVVGPNGSGKSNVVDSIKWLLGDQSPKSLRGKEMTDVIFNGALGRKPSAFAEAMLTFDNSKQTLHVDTPEVQIGRRLWQNGESEYLINGVTSRLKDIRDLFLGTGAGAAAYSIIEQGRVDQILQANASTRRVVFEEAAGISRYKLRKVETLRKLERVAQNVLRLTDIVDEVEAQVNSAKTQAAKALKYREVEIELRELWFGLAADDARTLTAQMSVVQETLKQDEAQLELLNVRRHASEQQLALFDQQIADFDDRLHAVERNHSQNGQEIAREQSSIQHLDARSHDLETDLARLRKQRNMLWTRLKEITALSQEMSTAFAEAQRAIHESHDLVEQHARRLQDHNALISAARLRSDELKNQIFTIIHDKNQLQNQATSLNLQTNNVRETLTRAAAEFIRCESELAQTRTEAERHLANVASLQAEAATVEVEMTGARQRHRQLSLAYEESQKRMAELREERSALQARKSILEDWESRQEGMGIGVKEILSRSKTSPVPPWNQLVGSVADLLVVDLDHAAILEVALGDRAQLLVMRDLAPLVEYLDQDVATINGRVGFVSLLDHSGSPSSHPPMLPAPNTIDLDLSPHPGVTRRADQLVIENLDPSCELTDELERLTRLLLGDTWIVEKLDIAFSLSAGPGRGCRFVTLQGERLEADGTLYVGLDRPESALVSRKSELRRLRNELIRIEAAMSEEEKVIADLVVTLSTIDEQAGQLHFQWQAANDAVLTAKSSLSEHEQTVIRLEKELARWEQERQTSETRLQQFQSDYEQAQACLVELDQSIAARQSEIDEHAGQMAILDQQTGELDQSFQSARLTLAKQEERLSTLESQHDRQADEERQRQAQLDEAERRLDSTLEKLRQYSMQILNARARLAELYLERDAGDRQSSQLHAEKSHLKKIRVKLQKDDNLIQQERRELQDQKHDREMRTRDIQYQITTLQQRIEEEYQLKLEEIVSTGASALALYKSGKIRNVSKPVLSEISGRQSDDHPAGDNRAEAPGQMREQEAEQELIAPAGVNVVETVVDEPISHGVGCILQVEADFNAEEFSLIREEIDAQVQRLRRKLKLMGNINPDSLQSLDELEKRYGQLKVQLDDLVAARSTLEEIIRRLNVESKRIFMITFETIRTHFRELFRKLFGGGEADIILEDPEDVLDCGIDIVARPPGKELRSITLMSGGEKTMTAVALLMAIFRSRPSPFCILDEVDAALDEANVERFVSVLREFDTATQFILITHNKRSMSAGSVLHGVTMEQSGISKRFSVRFEDVNEKGEFTKSADGQNQAA
ncbi:MAG: chromosome segregation protein SMC [Planctomycetaceae bacterium]